MQNHLDHLDQGTGFPSVRVLSLAQPAEEPPVERLAELQQGLARHLTADAVHEDHPHIGRLLVLMRFRRGPGSSAPYRSLVR
jgi:hypothetical protein